MAERPKDSRTNDSKLTVILRKLAGSRVSTKLRFVNMLMRSKSNAISHLPDIVSTIESVWKSCVLLTFLMFRSNKMRKLILSTHASHRGNKWMTLLDKLSICSKDDLNTLPMYLLQTSLLELISKEKDCKPFWTPAYKELSENLLSPTEIACVALDSNSSSLLLQKPEAKLQFLTTTETRVENKNSQKTCFQLSTSTLADKWENEVIPTEQLKAVKLRLNPNSTQKKILKEWMKTSNFVYNKTVASINIDKRPVNFINLRDLHVTAQTKKSDPEYSEITSNIKQLCAQRKIIASNYAVFMENLAAKSINGLICVNPNKKLHYKNSLQQMDEQIKNERGKLSQLRNVRNTGINDWELRTPKEIRAGAVDDACKAMKTGFSNLKAGRIKYFRLHFRKRTEPNKCISVAKNFLTNVNGNIQLAPQFLKENSIFKIGTRTKKKHRDIEINHDSRIVCQKNVYWLLIPRKTNIQSKRKPVNYCGIDPGVRTFMTAFGNNGLTEYDYREKTLRRLDLQISNLKSKRNKKPRARKRIINKLETRKSNLVDELHWKTINHITKNNDFIFYGNIKSHNIVKKGKNRTLNRDMNNLKFYQFKERLLFKAVEKGCKVHIVNEAYTTKTCSFCGCENEVGASKIFKCKRCNHVVGRDVNAGKNILMKGIILNS